MPNLRTQQDVLPLSSPLAGLHGCLGNPAAHLALAELATATTGVMALKGTSLGCLEKVICELKAKVMF
jgi:hypothetical protein